MKIGILGAGYVGQAVAKAAKAAGHDVMLSNSRDPRTLFSEKNTLGVAVGTAAEAAAFGDVIVAGAPLWNFEALPADELAGKVVIDTMNYYPGRDGAIPPLDREETTTSAMVAEHLRGAKVVKALNAIMMSDLGPLARPAGATDRKAIPIAGDDAAAKETVATFLDDIGYDALDAGTLAESWRFERDRPAYCVPMDRAALERTLAATTRGSWQGDKAA